ncbi:Lrp/AsnC family transcriptional regulator [Pectinatus sottacetonis]|uniref:Lrp/AsnC family transcriptional regulator n=1 Tax=Pectinatus sottacetonis TaxID=1002795 RepID=UPI0018C8120A|nr:Lrp/AsnC family transcriptional regulator [Pectinatus sottacetonis]
MKFKNLDEIDEKILQYLSENGRMTNAELGRSVGLTRAAVRERVNQLVKRGIIEHFTIVVNPLKAGKQLSLFFDIAVEWSYLDSVAEKLLATEEVTNVYAMSGKPHLHVHALLDTQEHAAKFMQTLKKTEGIVSVETELLLTRYKERDSLLI